MNEETTFCFHSVRSNLTIPPVAAWPSERLRDEYEFHLTVDPSWFRDWCVRAQLRFGEGLHVTFDDAYRDVVVPALYAVDHGIKTTVFASTAHVGMSFPHAPYELMDWWELAYIEARGVLIGAHGHRHLDMTKLCRSELEAEVVSMLHALSDFKVHSMAPPHGHFDERLVELLRPLAWDIYGVGIYPAGMWGSKRRIEADMRGFSTGPGKEEPWPWEI